MCSAVARLPPSKVADQPATLNAVRRTTRTVAELPLSIELHKATALRSVLDRAVTQ